MAGHVCDQVRLALEAHAGTNHLPVRDSDVGHGKVQNGAGMVELRLLGVSQHEPHPAAVEENQATGVEQQWQPEPVPVEGGGAVEVVNVDGDLSQPGNCDRRSGGGHSVSLQGESVRWSLPTRPTGKHGEGLYKL